MTESNPNPPELSYATPDGAGPSPLAAAVWIAIVGLGLIFLGGCFLIGVLIVKQMPFRSPIFTGVLYLCAAGCIGGAVWALVAGLGRLWTLSRRQ
jgi:hypothetical protein